jgi:hypothetical protein
MSRRFSARVSCSCSRRSAARGGRQTGGGLVRRRGTRRAARNHHTCLGETWLPPSCPARSTL